MKTWNKKLHEKMYELIKEKKKTVEGRVNDDKTAVIPIKDIIIWNETLKAEVVDIKKYQTFKEMLEKEGVENVLPGLKTIDEGVEVYYMIPGYKEKEKNGVLAFHLTVIE